MGGIEGYKRIRAASLGISFEGGVIGGRGWTYAAQFMGVVGGLVSIWDGMNKLTESAEATKTGQSLSAHHALILGGFGVVSGIFSIIMIGASTIISMGIVGLVVSIFFGVLTLILGWRFVTTVSPAVQMWVNRGILGKPSTQEDMQILPFEDLASEQSSLEMVFQGILVDLSWKPVIPNTTEFIKSRDEIDSEGLKEEVARASRLVEVCFKLKVPKLNVIDLIVRFYPNGRRTEAFFDWGYGKLHENDTLTPASNGQYSQAQNNETQSQPEFTCSDGYYEASWSTVYEKSKLTRLADFDIELRSSVGRFYVGDTLTLSFESRESN